jgi:hypothetical protein
LIQKNQKIKAVRSKDRLICLPASGVVVKMFKKARAMPMTNIRFLLVSLVEMTAPETIDQAVIFFIFISSLISLGVVIMERRVSRSQVQSRGNSSMR